MFVHFNFQKKNNIVFAAFFALAVLMLIFGHYPVWFLFAFGAVFFLLMNLQFRLPNTVPDLWATLWSAILLALGPVFTTFMVQHIILENELAVKTSKAVMKYNILLIGIVYLAVFALTASIRLTWTIVHSFFIFFAFIDYYVYEFRQNEISFNDATTIGTGISVAKAYRPELNDRGSMAILMTLVVFVLIWKSHVKFTWKWFVQILVRAAAIAGCVFLVNSFLPGGSNAKALGRATQTWEKKGTYRNGFILNLILGYQDSKIDPPSGYSVDGIKELEAEYGPNYLVEGTEAETEAETEASSETASSSTSNAAATAAFKNGKRPTIITIMDESFADFRVVGDFEASEEIMPYIDSLKENTTKGYALASVFGAKTPNSEWEYMSSNSMAFLPDGSVVYQQFLKKTPTTIVSNMKNLGYTTVGMHPYFAAGWRRSTVYPWLGFDEMKFMDTGDFDDTKLLRDYITDQECFDKIIDRYEQKSQDEDLFIMGITMQNHGGYKEEYDNFTPDVHYMNGIYPAVDQYLSVAHQTDAAVQSLIEYFQSVDEPVEIVFFGDHQPSLPSGFFRTLNGHGVSNLTLDQLENLFTVPFFIWTNYDSEEVEVERTSFNYLTTLALEKAGIELPPFNKFLADMMEAIPAINSRGYYSISNGKFVHIEDAVGTEKEWIEKYQMLQYNSMFDTSDRSDVFFPYILDKE